MYDLVISRSDEDRSIFFMVTKVYHLLKEMESDDAARAMKRDIANMMKQPNLEYMDVVERLKEFGVKIIFVD